MHDLEHGGAPTPKLRWIRGEPQRLVELDVRPSVRLSLAKPIRPCEICGRLGVSAPETIVLDRTTYDDQVLIQRIVELPTYIVVSDALKESIERNGLTGAVFKSVAAV